MMRSDCVFLMRGECAALKECVCKDKDKCSFYKSEKRFTRDKKSGYIKKKVDTAGLFDLMRQRY